MRLSADSSHRPLIKGHKPDYRMSSICFAATGAEAMKPVATLPSALEPDVPEPDAVGLGATIPQTIKMEIINTKITELS